MSDLVSYQTRAIIDIADGPQWVAHVVIDDETDSDATQSNADWTAEEFTLDDLFGSTGFAAAVVVTLNGDTREMTGEEFYKLDLAHTISDDAKVDVVFEDRA